MTGDDVNQEMIALRRQLAAVLARYDAGERSALYPELRMLTDAAICLLDEAPERKQTVINRLIDRCEELMLQLMN